MKMHASESRACLMVLGRPDIPVAAVIVYLLLLGLQASVFRIPVIAGIYRWDNGQLLTQKDAEPGADLSQLDLGFADLASSDLSDACFDHSDLTHAHLMVADLRNAAFRDATLTNVDLTGARITGADFAGSGITSGQLYSTVSYQDGDLSGVGLSGDLSGWKLTAKNLSNAHFHGATLTAADFSGANLTDAVLYAATLPDANFTGAVVTGADFSWTTTRGFTAEQLYSTTSYRNGNLSGVNLERNDLSGWDFAGKDLAGADFGLADLTNADLSGANLADVDFWAPNYELGFAPARLTGADLSLCDLRGAEVVDPDPPGFYPRDLLASAGSTENAILPDGRIEGLAMEARERLTVRDYGGVTAIPVTVESVVSLDPTAALRMVFEDDDWGSTISFEPGIAVSLDGTLELVFSDGTNRGELIGTSFDLFDWDGAVVAGTFDHIVTEEGAIWDTSQLYITGEVTLIAEPSTVLLLTVGTFCFAAFPWRRRSWLLAVLFPGTFIPDRKVLR